MAWGGGMVVPVEVILKFEDLEVWKTSSSKMYQSCTGFGTTVRGGDAGGCRLRRDRWGFAA